VIDKAGAVVLPGSTKVLDRDTGKLVPCDASTCPHAVNGVNHAPFAAFGGWSGGINKAADARVKEAAYAFFSHMSQPAQSNVDVTIGKTGFNPYRLSQFKNLENWTKAGMSEAAASDYLGAIQASLNSPNMVLDLRIAKNQAYQQVVLDTAIARLLAATGGTVQREYYFNDAGRQMTLLGESVRARFLQLLGRDVTFPPDGYQGGYIAAIAADLRTTHGDAIAAADLTLFREAAEQRAGAGAVALYLRRIESYKKEPPPGDWDGVTSMTSK